MILGILGYFGIQPFGTKSKSETNLEELARQETALQNTEKIIQLIKKGIEPKRQLIDELEKKNQELVEELEKYTTKDKRAEEALVASKAGDYEKARVLFETLREEEKGKEKEHAENGL